jgi:hypothetical protein
MPPQKNSGNRAAKKHRESGALIKSNKEVVNAIKNLDDLGERKHISRVVRSFGNGRVEVFYVKQEKNRLETFNQQAIIRGTFRGRGKRDVWIDIGSFVIVEENLGLLEIVGILTRQEMKEIVSLNDMYRKVFYGEEDDGNDVGIEFDQQTDEEEEKKPTDTGIVPKKDKVKHKRENIPVDHRDDNSDVDIDDI